MLRVFEDYLEQLGARHADIERAVSGLPIEALDWVPGPGMNSLTVLTFHSTGAERYWIGDVGAQDPKQRDRDAEFRMQGLDENALAARLRDNLEYARGVLAKMTLEDLAAVRVAPRDGQEYTVFWALAHALEHTAVHAGHAEITRQLWDQRQG